MSHDCSPRAHLWCSLICVDKYLLINNKLIKLFHINVEIQFKFYLNCNFFMTLTVNHCFRPLPLGFWQGFGEIAMRLLLQWGCECFVSYHTVGHAFMFDAIVQGLRTNILSVGKALDQAFVSKTRLGLGIQNMFVKLPCTKVYRLQCPVSVILVPFSFRKSHFLVLNMYCDAYATCILAFSWPA